MLLNRASSERIPFISSLMTVSECMSLPAYRARIDARAKIHALYREVRREEHCLRNRLLSIAQDADFVAKICHEHFGALPVVANLRCGRWYVRPNDFTNAFAASSVESNLVSGATSPVHSCTFKSGDGHFGHWKLNVTRLNLHLLPLLIQHRGVVCQSVDFHGDMSFFSRVEPLIHFFKADLIFILFLPTQVSVFSPVLSMFFFVSIITPLANSYTFNHAPFIHPQSYDFNFR